MSLINLTNYWSNKSIKLSDAFAAYIKLEAKSEEKELFTCTGFSLPKLEYDEEVYEYGNTSQVIVKPKYDSCKELTLDFIETLVSTKSGTNYSYTLSQIFKYMNFNLTQKYGNYGLYTNYAQYSEKIIPYLYIKVLDNRLWKAIYKYTFENLKIVNYSIYSLENQGESPCKVTVTLAFETYKKEIINEAIKYSNTQKEKQTKPQEPILPAEQNQEEKNKEVAKLISSIYSDGVLTKEEVKQLQEALGFKGKAADGIAGTNTQKALKKWINENGELLNETMETEGPGAGKVIEYAENGKSKKALGKNNSDVLMNMINQSVIGAGVDGDFGKGSKKALETYKEKHVDEWERTVEGMDNTKEKAEKQTKINAIKEKQKEDQERKLKYEAEREMLSNPDFNDSDVVPPIQTQEEFERDVKTELMMAAKAQEQSRGRGAQPPIPNQNATGGEAAYEPGMDVLTQKTKEDAYAKLEKENKEPRSMTREPNLQPGAAHEEGQLTELERTLNNIEKDVKRKEAAEEKEWAKAERLSKQADKEFTWAVFQAQQESKIREMKAQNKNNQQAAQETNTGNNTSIETSTPTQTVQKQEQPKQQKQTQQNSKMTSNDIQEMAKRAAELDKNDSSLKKGQKGTYLQAGLNAMGLDEKGRSEFMATYNANFQS